MPVFSPQNAAEFAARSHIARQRKPVQMLNEMQDQLMQAVLDPETEPREKAQCACAWDKLEARKAVLCGKPANTSQSIRETPAKRKPDPGGPLEQVK